MSNTKETVVSKTKAIVTDIVVSMGTLGVQSIVSLKRDDDGQHEYAIDMLLGCSIKVTLVVAGFIDYPCVMFNRLNVSYLSVTSAWDGHIQEKVASIVTAIERVAHTYQCDNDSVMPV